MKSQNLNLYISPNFSSPRDKTKTYIYALPPQKKPCHLNTNLCSCKL